MKIAIFHNYMDNIGGAEKVGLTLARELNGDIYTTNIDREKIKKMGYEDVLPRIYSIGKIPINAPLRQQIALHKFRKLNLAKRGKKYDFYIIDGDWAVSAAVNHKPNMWYIHSPIREIWDLYKYTRQNTVRWFARPLFDIWVIFNRHLNRKYVRQVDICVSNSDNTRMRVIKYLKRNPEVIHPPIETNNPGKLKINYGNYWLSVNRLINHKRVDIQMKAFAELPNEKLIIVGSHEQSRHFIAYAKYCNRIKPKNVEIRKWVDNGELQHLYANCKGFITTSHNEDFGMNVVEAMAFGKPVIAPNEGGYKESIINGVTGILIDKVTTLSLVEAIKKINMESVNNANISRKYKVACQKQAALFDTKVFITKILRNIKPKVSNKK